MTFVALATLAYCIVTFPYALVWHMVLFRDLYRRWEYFGGNAKPQLGLLAMVVQGFTLSLGLSLLPQYQASLAATMAYALLCGVFFWSSHVVATMAKHAESRHLSFLFLETFYLAVQFGLFGMSAYGLHQYLLG